MENCRIPVYLEMSLVLLVEDAVELRFLMFGEEVALQIKVALTHLNMDKVFVVGRYRWYRQVVLARHVSNWTHRPAFHELRGL